MTAPSPSRNGVLHKTVAMILIASALVALVTFAVSANLTAETALETGRDREVRLRAIERELPAMAADIKHIRQMLEHERKESP